MPRGEAYLLGYKWIYFLVAAFFITFLFLYLRSAFSDYQAKIIQCNDIALEEIMIAKILYSDCFTYEDPELKRTIAGTIDQSKFSQQTLEQCFSFITKKVNISVEGKSIGKEIYNPKKINKIIWFYTEDEKKLTTIQFTFEEPAC